MVAVVRFLGWQVALGTDRGRLHGVLDKAIGAAG